jgi:hypothetical protein
VKLSELQLKFDELGQRVNRLVKGVPAQAFEGELLLLTKRLSALERWTKPRGGGSFEVDVEPYLSAGGAPAFMRDHAGLLLAAATTLRNGQRALRAMNKVFEYTGGEQQDDRHALAVPLGAPLQYSDADLRKVQRVFKFLYAGRAYRKLNTGAVMVRSRGGEDKYLPDAVQTIEQLSRHNLRNLRQVLRNLSEPERALYEALRSLPFCLKHATTLGSWSTIINASLIFSKDALRDWNIVVPTNTPASDEIYKQDVDFAFFRVEVGSGDWISRFGEEVDDEEIEQVRVAFNWNKVLQDGWVTLHDMLAPLGMEAQRAVVHPFEDPDTVLRESVPDMAPEGAGAWIHWRWKHRFVDPALAPPLAERKVHIFDEVFYGPDILEGLVLSLLRDLREMPTLQAQVFASQQTFAAGAQSSASWHRFAHWLVKSLFRVEAKYPSAFGFGAADIEAEYRGRPPALEAATIPTL